MKRRRPLRAAKTKGAAEGEPRPVLLSAAEIARLQEEETRRKLRARPILLWAPGEESVPQG